jgi:hypothetical protein
MIAPSLLTRVRFEAAMQPELMICSHRDSSEKRGNKTAVRGKFLDGPDIRCNDREPADIASTSGCANDSLYAGVT